MTGLQGHEALTAVLAGAGFIAASEEADELLARANGDAELLDAMVRRRLTGEPLAWITGTAPFAGRWIRVLEGVYVPRFQTEELARRAVARLPEAGTAIDLCTGSGAVARTLMDERPRARVVATDVDPRAVACARANGVEAYEGDLFEPLPPALRGTVDVVAGVVPYVPTAELGLLHRDALTFESPLAYDGGADGLQILRRAARGAAEFLRPGGALLLELGGEQAAALRPELLAMGFAAVTTVLDEDGDVRGAEATLGPSASRPAGGT
jgi:release factor glutamine methyltransferase